MNNESKEKKLEDEKRLLEKDFADKLLNRPPQPNYTSMWADLLRREKVVMQPPHHGSLLLFRFGQEWLGLGTKFMEEVIDYRTVHTVPNSRTNIFLGVVNLRGQLRLSVALNRLLEIPADWEQQGRGRINRSMPSTRKYPRMLAIRRASEMWVFPADEVQGVVNCNVETLDNVPDTVGRSTANFLKGIWIWESRPISIIDEELIFESLKRMVP